MADSAEEGRGRQRKAEEGRGRQRKAEESRRTPQGTSNAHECTTNAPLTLEEEYKSTNNENDRHRRATAAPPPRLGTSPKRTIKKYNR